VYIKVVDTKIIAFSINSLIFTFSYRKSWCYEAEPEKKPSEEDRKKPSEEDGKEQKPMPMIIFWIQVMKIVQQCHEL
jgi:hypothetical protein